MKARNILKRLILVLALHLLSCTSPEKDEQIFDQKPYERLSARKKELNDLLQSSKEGWKLIYFPNTEELGGFTHLFKFPTDNEVIMASDYDKDTNPYPSRYDISLGSTVSLVFSTKNRIHLLSDAANTAVEREGGGYSGDFQFLYYGHTKDEMLFTTNRTVKELRFVKATAKDWQDLHYNLTMEAKLKTGKIEFIQKGKKEVYNYHYNSKKRVLFISKNNIGIGYGGIAFLTNGLIMYPSTSLLKDKTLEPFIFDKAQNTFTAKGPDDLSCIIRPN